MAEPKAYKGKLGDFKPDSRNLNRHTQRGRGMVEASQRQRGFGRPGFAARDKTMLGGNLSIMEVAPDIGLGNGDVFVVETDGDIPIIHLRRDIEPGTEEAVLLAAEDNQSALVSIDFDPERLAEEIAQGVDFSGVFTEEEQKSTLGGLIKEPPEEHGSPQVDRAEELRQEWGTEVGQLWALGEHRLAVGDCTDRGVVERVMGGERGQLIVSDPPYGQQWLSNHYGPNSSAPNPMGRLIGDEKPNPKMLHSCLEYLASSGALYICTRWKQCEEWRKWINDLVPVRNIIIWQKNNWSAGDLKGAYGFMYEQIIFASYDTHNLRGARLPDVWEFDRIRPELHPTQKPVELIERCIDKSSDRENVIIDPCLGSGTTLMACENLNRRCRGIEIDPGYAAVTLQRFLDHTGVKPELIPNL